jgi:hypothetical protein
MRTPLRMPANFFGLPFVIEGARSNGRSMDDSPSRVFHRNGRWWFGAGEPKGAAKRLLDGCRESESALRDVQRQRIGRPADKRPSKVVWRPLVIGIEMMKQCSEPQQKAVLHRFGFRHA